MFLFSKEESSFCPNVEWLLSPEWKRVKETDRGKIIFKKCRRLMEKEPQKGNFMYDQVLRLD
jgi:hypothetical protein